jgi:hypothetical protein
MRTVLGVLIDWHQSWRRGLRFESTSCPKFPIYCVLPGLVTSTFSMEKVFGQTIESTDPPDASTCGDALRRYK